MSDQVRDAREELAADEPLFTDRRTVTKHGDGLYVNPTDYGAKTLGLSKGDAVTVDTYRDMIIIRPAADDE